jgi:hypothetical protein
MTDTSAEARKGASSIIPIRTGRIPCCQYIRGQRRVHSVFEQSDMRTGLELHAFAIENSVVNGGSLTPQEAKSANQRITYMGFTRRLYKDKANLISSRSDEWIFHKNKNP